MVCLLSQDRRPGLDENVERTESVSQPPTLVPSQLGIVMGFAGRYVDHARLSQLPGCLRAVLYH
jgi:hypothetical protein